MQFIASSIFSLINLTFRQQRDKQVTPRGHQGLVEIYALFQSLRSDSSSLYRVDNFMVFRAVLNLKTLTPQHAPRGGPNKPPVWGRWGGPSSTRLDPISSPSQPPIAWPTPPPLTPLIPPPTTTTPITPMLSSPKLSTLAGRLRAIRPTWVGYVLFNCGILTLIFTFFGFGSNFFPSGFSQISNGPFQVQFFLVNEISLSCFKNYSAMFFLLLRLKIRFTSFCRVFDISLEIFLSS